MKLRAYIVAQVENAQEHSYRLLGLFLFTVFRFLFLSGLQNVFCCIAQLKAQWQLEER